MWCFWWLKWHRNRVFSKFFGVTLSASFHHCCLLAAIRTPGNRIVHFRLSESFGEELCSHVCLFALFIRRWAIQIYWTSTSVSRWHSGWVDDEDANGYIVQSSERYMHNTRNIMYWILLLLNIDYSLISTRTLNFDPKLVHVAVLLDRVTLGRFISEFFDFPLSVSFHAL